jgi:drug/metabolite transporter (DMT)-like permease
MRKGEYALLVALGAMWGLSYVFYRVGAPALGPALFVELRVLLAGMVLLGYLAILGRLSGTQARLRARWRQYLVLGALNAAIPFTLIAIAELTLPASFASVLNSTAPLFSALLGIPLLGQWIGARQGAGIVLGIAGVVVLVGAAPFALTPVVIASALASLSAAFAYALAAIYVRRSLAGEDPLDLSVGQQLAGALLLIPFAAYEVPSAHFTSAALESVLGIALLSTALAYVIYFRILQSAGPTEALTVTFLIPIFGVLWGYLLLHEPLGIGLVAGVVLILAGVALATRLRARTPARAPGSSSSG